MIEFYKLQVKLGKIQINSIPALWRALVQQALSL